MALFASAVSAWLLFVGFKANSIACIFGGVMWGVAAVLYGTGTL